ncbi:SACE_7040 family transcriptional regulator [Streptomyces sp. MUM 178J]|uniref:SACE_7040 family transcriptional regulator n=1 Tax=Streptomyces sp. MUM 178J TaxID=2791991 RepID=UPI001F045556|nr:TetR/AcrR family transcriptional regulator [Streptomyces sp. MUM 178J]WRQ79517.1 TetR/AcrR family transcriptional regulator [Streptomyces sp. MUM 178J]
MSTRTAAPTRREQILREAARLFAERGFHGVGVDEIGAAVGISGPGLYRHFAGKDAMLAELLVGISERLLTGGRHRVAEADGDPAAVLASLIDGHIDFALDDRPLITLHDRELDRLRDADRRKVRQLQRQYVELWVAAVRDICPEVPEAQARAAVHAVFGLLNSTPHLGSYGSGQPGRAATEALLRRLAHGAFGALAPRRVHPNRPSPSGPDGPSSVRDEPSARSV